MKPCFGEYNLPLRLNKYCAAFVDVIHTDGALKPNSGFGIRDVIG